MRIPKRRKFLTARKRLDGGQTCAESYEHHVNKREESDDQTKSCETWQSAAYRDRAGNEANGPLYRRSDTNTTPKY